MFLNNSKKVTIMNSIDEDLNIAWKLFESDSLNEEDANVTPEALPSYKKYSGNDQKTYEDVVKFVWNFDKWPSLDKLVITTRGIDYARKYPDKDRSVIAHAMDDMLLKVGNRKITKPHGN